ALVQDAAYATLLRSQRIQIHARVARSLDALYPEISRSQPEVIAHHYTQAGLLEPAVERWLAAGKLAGGRSAKVEAVRHLTRGIELVGSLPPSPERDRKELDLQLALVPPMMAIKGYGSNETLNVFQRARELFGDDTGTVESISVLWGLWHI